MKKINIKTEFATDYITREAGERLRHMIEQALQNHEQLELDFFGITIASTSFFDEGIAKLALNKWSYEQFIEKISLKNLHPRDEQVLKKMCEYRGFVPTASS